MVSFGGGFSVISSRVQFSLKARQAFVPDISEYRPANALADELLQIMGSHSEGQVPSAPVPNSSSDETTSTSDIAAPIPESESEDLDSSFTLEIASSPESNSSDPEESIETDRHPYLHHSNSSFLRANAFAPPYYNRPPTPLPASPSLTSLLRPPFSTTTSRPTTPDTSDNDTPNDTEAAVAKSARTATTVPRASPKVPTYEYYGFVLYLLSSLVFRKSGVRMALVDAYGRSDVSPLVLSPVTLPPPTRSLLLPKSLVVPCHPFISCHDDHLHLRRSGFLQYRISHTADEWYREYCGRCSPHCCT